MRQHAALVVLLAAAAPGCGSEKDPFAAGNDGGTTAPDASVPAIDAAPVDPAAPNNWPERCEPKPARVVVLGDSIAACSNVGGKDSADCASKKLHAYVESIAPGATYQNVAVGGAVTADVPNSQLANVSTGPGHVLVVLTVGGNDLSPYIFQSDAATMQGYTMKKPTLLEAWGRIYSFFADTSKFPDGATILMSTQYNPFDDCTASPYNLSALKIQLLHEFNGELAMQARTHPHVFIADPFTVFLGHGHHYNVMSCPHYSAGSVYWMGDLIHPNVTGHGELAKVWTHAADELYKDCAP